MNWRHLFNTKEKQIAKARNMRRCLRLWLNDEVVVPGGKWIISLNNIVASFDLAIIADHVIVISFDIAIVSTDEVVRSHQFIWVSDQCVVVPTYSHAILIYQHFVSDEIEFWPLPWKELRGNSNSVIQLSLSEPRSEAMALSLCHWHWVGKGAGADTRNGQMKQL